MESLLIGWDGSKVLCLFFLHIQTDGTFWLHENAGQRRVCRSDHNLSVSPDGCHHFQPKKVCAEQCWLSLPPDPWDLIQGGILLR